MNAQIFMHLERTKIILWANFEVICILYIILQSLIYKLSCSIAYTTVLWFDVKAKIFMTVQYPAVIYSMFTSSQIKDESLKRVVVVFNQ